jgi:hypothetical protein
MNQPQPSAARQIVASAWRDQAVWSETANRLKADLTKWRHRAAVAAVAGAFLQTLAGGLAGLGERWWWLRALIALAGAVILAVVPYVLRTKASKEQVRAWVRARSASEALKEEIYRYLVGAAPFGPDRAPADLVSRCQVVKDKVRDLGAHAYVEPPKKERPLELDADGYIEMRVNDQIERFYRPKGRENAVRAGKLHGLEFALGLIAVVMGALASAAVATGLGWLSYLGSWVAVVTTAGGAVTAHLAASRYDHAAMTYFATADRLAGLRDAWLADANRLDPARVDKLVDDCENAISTENEAWLAEWTREEPAGSAGGS